ncbi:MAG: hypothetical protein ABI969_04590, partial [bacterium]
MTDALVPQTPPTASRARRIVRAMLVFVIGPIVVGFIVVLVLAMSSWGHERVRRFAVSRANQGLIGELSIGEVGGNLLTGATLTNVQLIDSLKHPVFAARRVDVRYSIMAALRREVVIRSLELDTPLVVLDKRPGARWNFQSLLKPSTTPKDTTQMSVPPQVSNITIRHGRFLYRRPWHPDSTLTAAQRDSTVAKALDSTARRRTVRVPDGYQRILDYRDIDAKLPVVTLARGTEPTAVQISALSMIAEPYRPPSIDIRSLVGTLYASKDSLWWRGAHMTLPGSNVTGDGTIGFHRSGFRLDLTGSPVAFADLRWLDPKRFTKGAGKLRYQMRITGDTAEYAISDADLTFGGDATLVGNAAVARVTSGKHAELLIRGADLTVARLGTATLHELAPSLKLTRSGTLDGHIVVSGAPSAMRVDADVRFDDASAGRSHVVARGGFGLSGGVRARDLTVQLLPLQVATLKGTGLKIPLGGTLNGTAVVSGTQRDGWSVRGDVTHVEHDARSRVVGNGRYQADGKRIVGDATLLPLSLITIGKFAPAAELKGSVTGRVHAEGTTRDLRVNGALHSESGGSVDGHGTVVLAGSRTRYDVSVVLDALNTSAFSRRAPVTRLSGTVAARGIGTTASTANAVFSTNLARSSYDTFSVERAFVRGSTVNGLLRLDTLDALDRGIRVGAVGTLGLTHNTMGKLGFSL